MYQIKGKLNMQIKCPHCNEVISLNPYKNAIRQWLNTEASAGRMIKISPERRIEIAQIAAKKRWEKHKMGGQKSKPPETE